MAERFKMPCGCEYETSLGSTPEGRALVVVEAVDTPKSSGCEVCGIMALEAVVGCVLRWRGEDVVRYVEAT